MATSMLDALIKQARAAKAAQDEALELQHDIEARKQEAEAEALTRQLLGDTLVDALGPWRVRSMNRDGVLIAPNLDGCVLFIDRCGRHSTVQVPGDERRRLTHPQSELDLSLADQVLLAIDGWRQREEHKRKEEAFRQATEAVERDARQAAIARLQALQPALAERWHEELNAFTASLWRWPANTTLTLYHFTWWYGPSTEECAACTDGGWALDPYTPGQPVFLYDWQPQPRDVLFTDYQQPVIETMVLRSFEDLERLGLVSYGGSMSIRPKTAPALRTVKITTRYSLLARDDCPHRLALALDSYRRCNRQSA